MTNSEISIFSVLVEKNNILPDNNLWKNRFEIHSESSDRIYIISQNIAKGYMGCSCPGWKRYRKCKHLSALGLPNNEVPVTLNLKYTD